MAKAKLVNGGFKPVEILITLETQEELDIFGSIFNYIPITEDMEGLLNDWCRPIRQAASKAGANIHNTETIKNACK